MADDFDLLAAQSRVLASGLRAPTKLVAIALLSHWSRKGRVFPSVARIAQLASLGRSTVIRELASLAECGAIIPKRARGKSNEYDLRPLASLPPLVPERDQYQSGTSPSVAPDQSHSGTSLVPERDPNKSKKESKKEPSSCASQSDTPPLALEPSPSKPERKPRSNGKAKTKAAKEAPDPRVAKLRDHYLEEYQSAKDSEPVLTAKQWPRAMVAFKELLEATKELEAAKQIITRAFDDEWHCKNRCQPWEIVQDANKFAASAPRKTKGNRYIQDHGSDPTAGATVLQ